MDKDKLFDSLDGLYAYDSGCHGSGIHDEKLRREVMDYIKAETSRIPFNVYPPIIAHFIREYYLSKEKINQGYGVEDVKKFIEWIDEQLGIN